MKTGDLIRVKGSWPGTKGKRFLVIAIHTEDGTVDCADRDGKQRVFPVDLCHVDRAETRARKA